MRLVGLLMLVLIFGAVAWPERLTAQWTYNTDQGEKSSQQLNNKNSSSIVINPPPVVDSSAPAQPIPNIPLILAPPFMPGEQRPLGVTPPPQGGMGPPR
jgi:hypothetical protein